MGVDFVSEHRLFLSPGRVWGVCDYSEYMVGHRLANAQHTATGQDQTNPLQVVEVSVPQAVIDAVLLLCSSADLGFIVVDVGLTSVGQWCVVEANPPFALSSYDLNIAVYVEYCCAAWRWILSMHKEEQQQGSVGAGWRVAGTAPNSPGDNSCAAKSSAKGALKETTAAKAVPTRSAFLHYRSATMAAVRAEGFAA